MLTQQQIDEMDRITGMGNIQAQNRINELRGLVQPKQDGLLKTVAKEAAGTLLVKPVARATELVGRTGILGSNIKRGFEEMADEGGQNIAGISIPSPTSRQVVGETLQTASYLFPYGKVAGLAGKAVGKVAGGVASGVTGGFLADAGFGLVDEEQAVGEALTPGIGTAIGGAVPLVGPAVRATGRATSKLGTKAVETVIPVSSKEAGVLQTYKANNPFLKRVADVLKGTEKAPTTAGKTTVTEGLMGTKSQIGIQAKRAQQKLWDDVISPRLKASEYAVDLDGFFNKIQDDIVKTTPEASRQKSLLNALQSFRDDYTGVNSVTLEKLQKLKEGWAEFIPEKAYRGENISGAANQVRKIMADESRQTIYSQLGDDVKQAYLDYGNLQGLKKMGQVSMTGQKLKGGTGGLVSEIFSQVVTPIGTVGGQAVYKVGKGIEFIGNLGAKNLGEALGIQGGLKFPGDKAVDDVASRLNKSQDTITPITAQTRKATTKNKIKDVNSSIPKVSQTTPTKSIPKAVDSDLSTSISKAKASGQSFDEWVKGQGETVYHGTAKESVGKIEKTGFKEGKAGDWGAGIYTTKNKISADMYGDTFGGKTIEAVIPKNRIYEYKDFFLNKEKASKDIAKRIIENNNVPETLKGMSVDDLAKRISETFSTENPKFWLEKAGYAGIKDTDRIVSQIKDEIVIFNPKEIKTRSQLKAEWDKVK